MRSKYSFSIVFVLIGFAFLLGRLSVHVPLPSDGITPTSRKTACPECSKSRLGATSPFESIDASGPSPKDWNTIAEQSGLLKARPPLKPAQSGVASYTIAPFQVLFGIKITIYLKHFSNHLSATHFRLATSFQTFDTGKSHVNTETSSF